MQDRLSPAPLVKRRRYLLKIARPADGAGTPLRFPRHFNARLVHGVSARHIAKPMPYSYTSCRSCFSVRTGATIEDSPTTGYFSSALLAI